MSQSPQEAPDPQLPQPIRPLSTVDVVLLGLVGDDLQTLLVRCELSGELQPNSWALPGRAINVGSDSDLLSCARSVVASAAGVATGLHMEPLGSWGSSKRDPHGWSAAHVYMALIPADRIPKRLPSGPTWHSVRGNVGKLKLAMDHGEILASALQRLRVKSEYSSLPAFLMPHEFTLPELQAVYELVFGWSLDKSAFRTRILSHNVLHPLGELRETAKRPAQLYRLRNRRAVVYFTRSLQRP